MRLLLFVATVVLVFIRSYSVAYAEPRVALVIGNAAYQFAPALKNTLNDANTVADALKSVGFDVRTATNLTRAEMDRVFREFLTQATTLGNQATALVFYAGQGVQIDSDDYLVPIDAKIEREADVLFQGIPLSSVLTGLSRLPTATRIVVLDTSRSNPFPTTGPVGVVPQVPAGTIVAFSTSPGADADEGDGANSPYTSALVETIKEPGLRIEQALEKVRQKVSKDTDGRQIPQESSSLKAPFSFVAAPPAAAERSPSAATTQPAGVPPTPVDAAARRDYELALEVNTKEAWEAFLQIHPSGFHATLARARLNRLSDGGGN
jgi:uncharacterized caspase-like protein